MTGVLELPRLEPIVTLPAGMPDATLGWEAIGWGAHYIRQPDGPGAGGPWTFTNEQVAFVLWWYALTEAGRWRFIRGVLRRSKGWGKSPFVAFLALLELCGPCRFHGWATGLREDAPGGPWAEWSPWLDDGRYYLEGEPMAEPANAAWVQLAGVSEKQTVNTMSMVAAMLRESPLVYDYGLDVGITRIFTAAGGRLEPITASSKTAEGARPTAVFEDETQHWTESAGGIELDATNRRNVAKIPGGTARVLETTNAHAAAENSVAERSHDAYLAMAEGRTRVTGLLYDSREAPPETELGDEASLRAGLAAAYGDSTWVDQDRLVDEVYDPTTDPSDVRRFYLNQIAAATDGWLAEWEWVSRLDLAKIIADGDPIVLGFDGSRKRTDAVTDATALVGIRVEDGHVFELGVWEQPSGPAGREWTAPKAEVHALVRRVFTTRNVVGFYADPARWETDVAQWEAQYGHRLKVKATASHPIQWWMNRPILNVKATREYHDAIVQREMTHDGSDALTRHHLNARRRATKAGIQIAKEHPESARKIDAAVAAVVGWQARLAALAAGVARARTAPRRVY